MVVPKEDEIRVLLVYHPAYLKNAPHILAAYESVLQEEGVPYETVDVLQLTRVDAGKLVKTVPVVIMPDNLLQSVPAQFDDWTKQYLANGGNIAVIYDAGIRDDHGHFREHAAFADIIGLNYITYSTAGTEAYGYGYVRFSSKENRDFFQIPMGKTIDGLVLSSYGYGPLKYPLARNVSVRDIPETGIYAYSEAANNERFPSLVLTEYAKGRVLYVNLPLGHLKANTDDLPLRSMLRTFLFDVVEIPHITNVEQGQGGIVINWHIDSSIEHTTLPAMQAEGFLRPGLRASFHITAGDFRDTPLDRLGYDAVGAGRGLTTLLKGYGVIGSHGGWAHNWFSENITKGAFAEPEIREFIAKNNISLETVVGYKVIEYSAPSGLHPQPATTKILEDMGFIAYYYTGDTGSGPNRTFYEGKMVSDKVIAFPVMPFGRTASLGEMYDLDHKNETEVTEWLFSILSYAARNRTVRLVYSHPYDIEAYPQAMKAFIDRAEAMQAAGEITVRPMSDFARFFLRFMSTTYAFRVKEKQLVISLKNLDDLAGITIALPKKSCQKPTAEGIVVREDERYYYLTVVGKNEKEKLITADTR
ncbi:hypothetical protein [Sporomusa malonica]